MTNFLPNFLLLPGSEVAKAKDFMDIVRYHLNEHVKGNGTEISNGAYKFLDALYDILTCDDRDFGWLVSYCSEDSPLIEDIFYDSRLEDYKNAVAQPTAIDDQDFGFMTRPEVEKTFWNVLARQITLSIPLFDAEKAKQHIERAVASMFDGSNHHHLHFQLFYVEKDLGETVFGRTSELGGFLIASNIPSFTF